MRRRMKFLPLLMLLFAAFAQAASAEDSGKSAQQKLDELKETGIFESMPESFQKDGTMTRAQFAKMLAVLKGLDPDYSGGGYSDVDLDDTLAAYIGAVTEAKLMIGTGDGKFDPTSPITTQQLIITAMRAMNLPVPDSGYVEGEVSDWALNYVAAAIEHGLIDPRDNYKLPADRNTLIETTYATNEQHVEENGFGITIAKQVGIKRIAVSLNASPDPSEVDFTVVRGSDRMKIDVESLEWSEHGRQVILQFAEPLEAGKYEVSISGSDAIDPKRSAYVVTTEAERVAGLRWGGPDTLPYNDNVEVPFIVLNQFDEAMDAGDVEFSISAVNASIERIPGRSAVLVHLLEKAKPGDQVDLVIAYAKAMLFDSKSYQVGEGQVISAIEIDGVPSEPLVTGKSAELIVRVYDQYGGLIKDAAWLRRELAVQSGSSRLASVSLPETDSSGNVVVRVTAGWAFWGNETVDITVSARSGSASATATLTVKMESEVIIVPVVIQPGNPTVTDEVYTVGSNFAFVTIETDNASQVYYYYESKGASPDGYTASEVMNKALAKQQGDSVAVSAKQASFTLTDLDFGQDYELFVVAANSSGKLSDVQVYELSVGYMSSYIELIDYDDSKCVLIFDSSRKPIFDAYYVLADQPIHATVDEIIENGTKVDNGMFVFELTGQVQYLYVVYDIGGEYELFAYASDTFDY